MADQRNITFGMQFQRLDEAVEQLESLQNSIEEIKTDMVTLEQEGDEVGSRIKAGAETAADEIEKIGTEAEVAGSKITGSLGDAEGQFRKIGSQASSMGKAIASSAGTALKEYNSLPKAIRAGMDGAFGYAEKRIQNFQKSATGGIKKLSQAFKDPIGTIKSELAAALQKAGKEIEDVEDDAEDAEKDLKDMGDSGESAGGSIKDALSSVAGKFAALQAGVEILKAGMEADRHRAAPSE